MRWIAHLTGLLLAAVSLTACVAGPGASLPGSSPSAPPTGSPAKPPIQHPTGRDALVLRITIDGGFVPPHVILTTLPVLSIYGDGRVIVQGAVPAIYPGPVLAPLWVRTITEAGLQKVLAAAAEAGLLGADRHYDDGGLVADAPTTTFILNAGGGTHTISAYALAEAEMAGPNLSKEDAAARKALRAFLEAVTDLPKLAGESELTAEHPYTPHAVRVFVSDEPPFVDENNPEQDPIAWPLKAPLAKFGSMQGEPGGFQVQCGVVEGADLDTLLPLIAKANTLTPWTSEGKSYSIYVRPLLPDESGCATV
ncbi:MAG: hypothetical protein FJ038_08675 [Chloroflexi bacterium]|nr:hypothetical protein [Chloroflexota bacterium]